MTRVALACVCMLAVVAPALGQSRSSLGDLIQAGNRQAALDRIGAGADVNEAQPDGTRPIHWAVYKADHELVGALIAKKATVDVVNEFGATPLAEAVKLADARMVTMLLAGFTVSTLLGYLMSLLLVVSEHLQMSLPRVYAAFSTSRLTRSGRRAAYATASGPPWETPSSGK